MEDHMLQKIHIALAATVGALTAASAIGGASVQECSGSAFDTRVVLTDILINRPAIEWVGVCLVKQPVPPA
jgi:hypothetical protein